MLKIGIISGAGGLPLSIGKNLIKKNFNIHFFHIKNFSDPLNYNGYNNTKIELTSFTNILEALKKEQIDKIIMVGKITRPSIKDINFDFNTISLIKDFYLESKGDDKLLKAISNFFLKKGYPLFDWKSNCKELFATKDNLTTTRPSINANKNKIKGLDVFKIIGKSDIGQSIVIQNQLILGFECVEGTDELIIRCNKYKKAGDKCILLKLSKYQQHTELDLPTIGIKTVIELKNNDFEGLFIEKNKCIILDKEKVIDFCNKNQLFLSTVSTID